MQLIIPAEAAHETVHALGDVGLVQFKDLNPDKSAFQRTYANQVKRCDEMLRRLRWFAEQIEKAELPTAARASGAGFELDELEAKLEELESELLEINSNTEKLRRSYSELVELQLVLEKAGTFFDEARADAVGAQQSDFDRASDSMSSRGTAEPLLSSVESQVDHKSVRLGFVTGVVPTEKTGNFERVLFRATRGNMFLKQSPIEGKVEDPASGEKVLKTVFVVFYAGERARQKIMKICEAFGANRYPFPEEFTRQRQMNSEVNARLQELQMTLDASTSHRDSTLVTVGNTLSEWTTMVQREKAIYHTLNMLSIDVTRQCLVAEGWIPKNAHGAVNEALQRAARQANAQVTPIFQVMSTREMPPTYFRTNKITRCFQDIVDAYGIPNYREANPTVFTIVTFPFLFAVMFGDLGHGILLFLAALYVVLNEKKLKQVAAESEMFGMMYEGRYVILLMAVFSIYVGILYNEFFSMPMTMFGGDTKFVCRDPQPDGSCPSAYTKGLVPDGTYPIGVDPVWHGTTTELTFTNSLKMKMSIVMGVTQMSLGIFMSFLNFRYRGDTLSIYCEFVPQIIFLMCLFGYLSWLIVLKWMSGSTADLYHVMINMFLAPGNVDCYDVPRPDGSPSCPENVMYAGQAGFQVFLVLVAFVCVPWMLFPKPYILKARHLQRARGAAYGALPADDSEDHHGSHGEHFDFGEVMVHQMIHTIEFVLGSVSNTASYLRLWALSLAHAQLSAVFYDRVLMTAISTGSVAAMVIGFAFFAGATIGVLLIMETLSAFLHALRLHWVEYNNKFFGGTGNLFAPFTFASL